MPNRGKKFSGKSDEKSVDKDEKNEKKSEGGLDSAKKKMERIDKAVSKDERDRIKNEVVKKKKKRRKRRPRKKPEIEERKQEAAEKPVSPFADSTDESGLPTSEYEQQREEEFESPVEVEPEVEEAESVQQEPINPFEAAQPPVSTIEKKALSDKPLDRKDEEVERPELGKKVEHKREETPEETGQSDEQLGEVGAAEETESADAAEVSVVEPGAESVSESVVEPAEVVKTKRDLSSETEEFKEEVWDILSQAGITKKRIVTVLVVFAIIILFIMFGGLGLFGIGGNGGNVPSPGEEKTVESGLPGIISSYVFGLEYTEPKTPITAVPIGEGGSLGGIEAVLYFGEGESEFESRLVYFVDLLRRMDSMYSTDIYALIDMSVDRRAALQEHIDEMDAIINEADSVYFEIKSRLESFDAEYEVLAVERDDLEVQFFTSTDELMPRASYEYLLSFIEVSEEAAEIKAYYNAYRMVGDLLVIYLDLLEPRYQDVVANTEALIKGIRVFDIPASDIEAILPVEEE